MTTTLATAAIPERILNAPSSTARGRIRSQGNQLNAVSPIHKAWSEGQPALSFSYRQPTQHWSDVSNGPDPVMPNDPALHSVHGDRFMSRKGQCLHVACQRAVAAIAASQHLPEDLHPFRSYDDRAGDPPAEHVVARRHGTRVLSLDMPVRNDGEVTITLADTVADITEPPTVFVTQDPEVRDQIAWEQSAYYSGPTTFFRRKWSENTGADFVAIDRWGDRRNKDLARAWWDRAFRQSPEIIDSSRILPTDTEACLVFERQKPINYPAVVDAYIDRIIELTGSFPTYEEQRRMAKDGANDRLFRQGLGLRVPAHQRPDLDPFRYRFLDEEAHEPFESIDVTELLMDPNVIAYAEHTFKRPFDQLLSEELAEIEAEIIQQLREENYLEPYTTRHLRNHPTWGTAAASRLHYSGAEYLAGLEDAIEDQTGYAKWSNPWGQTTAEAISHWDLPSTSPAH